ncbi:MAG: 4Fe-4S dicluster domain-containing protein, partial [Flavobacterium sp.]|nr:4Fe-4S dicluster domain-containing protein [Flavobacterium sp.]
AELADLVVNRFNGSLKAEHGTGRNMAPFVEKEWGTAAYEIMKRIKNIFDPNNKINPDVLINPDPKAHLKNLKPMPESHAIVDKCMECGFCEPHCVSEGLTLSPRQRIVIAREISRLEETNEDAQRLAAIRKDVSYQLDETCATDGLCALACPVHIDTGKFVKTWRANELSDGNKKVAAYIGSNMAGTTAIMRTGLKMVSFFHSLLGTTIMTALSNGFHFITFGKVPKWIPEMPKGADKINTKN